MTKFHRVRSISTVLLLSLCSVSRAQDVANEQAAVAKPETPAISQTVATPNVQARRATALVFLGADGITYFRSGLRAATAEEAEQKLAAVVWLKQTAPDALARVFPGGGGVLVRRDRRAREGGIVQKLLWIKPAPGGGVVEEELPFDSAAFAANKNIEGFSLRSISNLQLPQREQGEATRVFLRVTFEKIAKLVAPPPPVIEVPKPNEQAATPELPAADAAKTPADAAVAAPIAASATPSENPATNANDQASVPNETREFLGWYDLGAKTFASIYETPRLVGAEVSPDGNFIHVLARDGEETRAILLDGEGKEKPAPALAALRAVGFLYRGWVDGARFSLKKAGQNQIVIYDAATDSVSAPKHLAVFAATMAPRGDAALTWPGEIAQSEDAPSLATDAGAQPIELDGPLVVADWSADGANALLLGAPDERRRWTRAWLFSPQPSGTREIVLPAPVSSAKFLYEAL